MKPLTKLFRSVRAILQKQKLNQELDEELQFHIQRQTEENIRTGMDPEAARCAAQRKFGWLENIKDRCRDQRTVGWMEDLLQDTRFGLRMLVKTPGFTAVAVLSLALGIGGNTAIFSVVNSVLLHPLPQNDPKRLVNIQSIERKHGGFGGVSPQSWQDLQQTTNLLSDLVVSWSYHLYWQGEYFVEDVAGLRVSLNFFSYWQLRPQLGRTFVAEEARPGGPPVIILSHEFWQNQCGGRREIIGQRIQFQGEAFTVVGVIQPRARGPSSGTCWWLPSEGPQTGGALSESWRKQNDYQQRVYNVYARRQPGVTMQQLQAALDVIAQRQALDSPETSRDWTLQSRPLQWMFSDELLRRTLWSLFGAIGFVLLIGCANVANLLVARNEARQRELFVRAALGAGRRRLAQQLLTESILLAALGGTGGLLVSWWGVHLITRFITGHMEHATPLGPNLYMFVVATALSVSVGVLVGFIPAWLSSRRRVDTSLKEHSPLAILSMRRKASIAALVVSEVALAFVLLTGAGLMINSVIRLLHVDPGFNAKLLRVRISARLPGDTESGPTRSEHFTQFIYQMQQRLAALPGVQAVGISIDDRYQWDEQFTTEGRDNPVTISFIGTGVEERSSIKAMKVPLRSGRLLDTSDRKPGRNTIIVNETLAHMCWPGRSAVGQRLRSLREKDQAMEVVGVVGDVRDHAYYLEARPLLYLPLERWPNQNRDAYSLYVRTSTNPKSWIPMIRQEIGAQSTGLKAPTFEVVSESLYNSTAQHRLYMWCLSGFAAVGLVLSVIGIYAVLAWTVVRRTKEIGIRMAVGASRAQAFGLILRQGMWMACIGILLGLGFAAVVTRFLGSFLFEVRPLDPITVLLVTLLLGAIAMLACYIPGRRAARIDPMDALRYE